MKVVIAKNCGLYPSKKLAERLIELGMTAGEWVEGVQTSQQEFELVIIKGEPESPLSRHHKDHYYFRDVNSPKFRTDSRLIQAVEEIGMKESADQEDGDEEFKIVEIPDGVEFYIDQPECSTSEIIKECHRSWS